MIKNWFFDLNNKKAYKYNVYHILWIGGKRCAICSKERWKGSSI